LLTNTTINLPGSNTAKENWGYRCWKTVWSILNVV